MKQYIFYKRTSSAWSEITTSYDDTLIRVHHHGNSHTETDEYIKKWIIDGFAYLDTTCREKAENLESFEMVRELINWKLTSHDGLTLNFN